MCTTCGCGEGNLYIEGDEHNPHSAFRSAPFAPAARPKMKITGIKAPEFTPSQTEEGDLHYGHGEAGTHAPGMSQRRMLEVEIDVLDKNNRLAERNRARFAARKQLVLNLVSSPGSGKTTLLNLIAGFVPYQHGSIQLAGKRIEGPGAERGVVFQNEGLLPWRNVQNNVAFGLQLAGIEKMQRLEIAHQMLKKVGLEGAEKRYIWQLSGGQRQRVGIARALAANPQLLLLDEPFGALDAFTRDQMQTLLLKLWQETGKQVLLITHDIEEAVFMATELVLLSPGPGRVLERLPLNFARRFVAGESSRSIKSDPQFIAMREYVLSRVFEQREAFS